MDAIMAKTLDEAIAILQDEVRILEHVLRLEEKKYQALKDIQLQQLMDINDQEEILLQDIHTKEEKRQHVFARLFPQGSDVHACLALIQDEQQRTRVETLVIQLANLRDRIKMQNEENKHLIQLNSEIISMTLGLFQKTHGETYTSPQVPSRPQTGASFLVNHLV